MGVAVMSALRRNDPFWLDKAVFRVVVLILALIVGLYGSTLLRIASDKPNPIRRPIERPVRKPIQRRLNKRYEHIGPVMAAGIRG